MTRKILRYAAACGAALICLTSCRETASLVTPEVSAPASDRSFVEGTEVVTTSTAAADSENVADTETETEKPFKVNVAKPRGHEIAKKSVIKNFETVLQNPELPTGCEVTSLCQTLNFLGFKIDKVKLADEFMPMDMNGSTTLDHAYIGDPKLEDGFGCFPPVIVETADTYFESVDSPCYAEDMSGIELEKLLYQVEEGRPIIAWCTIDLVYFEPEHRWTTSDGEEMWFSGMQHCVTIYGYDLKKKILYVADPLKGNVEYDLEHFKEMFDLIGKKAVVICGDSETEGHYNNKKDYQKSKYLTRKELEKKEKEEAEAAKKAAEEARKAEEEAKKAEEEARIAEEEAKKAAEEAARQAEEEARKAEEEAARKAEEEARKAEEEAARKAEEEARKAEEEAARKAEEEAKKAEEKARKAKEEAKKEEEAAKYASRSTSVVVTTTKTTTTKAKTTSVKTNTTKATSKKTTTTSNTTTTATKSTTKAKTTSVKTKSTKAKTTKTSTTTASKGGKK